MNLLERDIAFGSLHFHVKFSKEDSIPDVSKDTSLAAFLRTVFRR